MSVLRERRHRETERSIQQAALRLAAEHGVESVTVEAICAAAGISVRTFFNYFPFKEAAFAISAPPFPEEAVAAFLSSKAPLLEALTELLVAQLGHVGEEDRRIVRVLRKIAVEHPRIHAMQISKVHEFDAELATLIAKRLGKPDHDTGCRAIAAALTAALRVVIDAWSERNKGDLTTALRGGLSALRLLARQSATAEKPRVGAA
jgi:AcrR family transcriptional regulator